MCNGFWSYTKLNSNLEFEIGLGEILIIVFINITSITNAIIKNVVKQFSPYLLSFGRMFFGLISLTAASHISIDGFSFNGIFNLWAILGGFLFVARNITLYRAIKLTKLSNIATINILGPLITFGYAYIL